MTPLEIKSMMGAKSLPLMVLGLTRVLQLRGKGHGKEIEKALIHTWRTRCELAVQLDKALS